MSVGLLCLRATRQDVRRHVRLLALSDLIKSEAAHPHSSRDNNIAAAAAARPEVVNWASYQFTREQTNWVKRNLVCELDLSTYSAVADKIIKGIV